MAFEVRTLKQFLDSDQVIDCDCSNYWVCSHTGPLRLEMAIQRLGWEFDFYEGRVVLSRIVYCSICMKREPTFRLGWKQRPDSYSGQHGAGMIVRGVLEPKPPMPIWAEPEGFRAGGSNVRKFGPGR